MQKILAIITAAIFLSACNHIKVNTTDPAVITLPTQQQPTNQQLSPPSTMNQPTTATQSAKAESAIISTSMGDISIKLYPKEAPITVSNFVGLAEGTINWVNPKTGQETNGEPLYNNTIFHRVIPGFMIQGGDPLGTGTGGPGYKFKDEFVSSLTFAKPYVLAMANSGPNSNGSQFFITVAPTTWLNGKHTIFGEVTAGQEVVDKIATAPTGANDKPVTDIVIKSIKISR